MRDLFELPANLPVPKDDGACAHLTGAPLPDVKLATTEGRALDLRAIERAVVFIYPRTGEPHLPAPPDWDLIPGARGCTPQSCGFRDLYAEFRALGYAVYGASTQTTEYQREFVARNHIPFEILSDAGFALTDALRLPTFVYAGERLIKRMAWVVEAGRIRHVFYPVFPPHENAARVIEWLRDRATSAD